MKKSNLKNDLNNQSKNNHSKRQNSGYYLDLTKAGLDKFSDKDSTDYTIGIIPYEIKTDNHPSRRKKGESTYNLEIHVHKGIGPNYENFLCMNKTFGKNCEICNKKAEYNEAGMAWDDIKHLHPSSRCIYIITYKGERFIYDVSAKIFEDLWREVLNKKEKKGESIFAFYLPDDDCRYLSFSTTDKKGIGRYVQFEFDKIDDYNEKLANVDFSLEELLIIPDQDRLRELMDGDADKGNDQSEDSTDNTDQNNDEDQMAADEYYNEVIENEDDTDIPEETEPEEPVRKKKKKADTNTCPYNFNFGVDFDEYQNCDECLEKNPEIHKACEAKSKEV